MTDREEFELKISMEYEQPPCIDRDCDGYADGYVDNAWWGWQARGELDAKRIDYLYEYIKKMDAVIDNKGITRSCINPLVDLTNSVDYMVKEIAELTANLEREAGRADAWVEAVRDLARELGIPDEDSNGSIQDWKRITAKVKQVKELEASNAYMKELSYVKDGRIKELEVEIAEWQDRSE